MGKQLYLQQADQLGSIDLHRRALTERHQTVDGQLKGLIAARLEASREALDLLQHSMSLVSGIRRNFTTIEQLCSQSTGLAKEYPLIKEVNTARSNLLMTKRELYKMLDIPQKVESLKQKLQDENNMLLVYSDMTELVRLRKLAESQAKQMDDEVQTVLKAEFGGLDELFVQLEAMLWERLAECVKLAQSNPSLLVKIMRIIEREDRGPDGGVRGYLGTCFEVLQNAVQRRFEDTLAPWDARNDVAGAVKAIEEELIKDVELVSSFVVPCFPPRFDIQTFFVTQYHRHLSKKLKQLGQSEDISIGGILALVSWVEGTYEPYLRRLGVLGLQPPLIACLEDLTLFYKSHLRKLMREWTERIVHGDPGAEPQVVQHIYYSQAPNMLFTFLNQQMEVVHTTRYVPLTVEVAAECVSVISYFQTLFISFIDATPTLPFDYLLALCNNSFRAYEYSVEFFENKIGNLLDDRGGAASPDAVAEAFTKVAKKASVRVIAKMMEDMSEVYPKFFMQDWYTANPPLMSMIVVTLKDYFTNDLAPHMLTATFQDLAFECLRRITKVYVGHLLEKKHPPFNASTVERMRKDTNEISAFFSLYIRDKTVEQTLQPLVLLRQLLEADSQMIPTYFDSLLEHFPDATLNVIEVLLENRSDLDRQAVREALTGCQAVWQRRSANYSPAGSILGLSVSTAKKKSSKTPKAFFNKLIQQF